MEINKTITSLLSEKMKSEQEYNHLLKDFKYMLFHNNETFPCDFCKHHIPCNKDCIYYQQGKGLTDKKGNYYDWEWTCEDWEYGTCDRLEKTPCYQCLENDCINWEYQHKKR